MKPLSILICSLLVLSIATNTIAQSRFEADPPVVQQITLKKLPSADPRGNNVVLMSQFSEREKAQKNMGTQLKFKLNQQDNLLIDDGKNGDDKANDGVFSRPMKASDNELLDFIRKNNEMIQRKNGIETVFDGRTVTTRRLTPVNLDAFQAGRPVVLDIAFASVITAANLPAIRDKSLMIRDVSVVEDVTRTYDPCRLPNKGNPNGVWSFKTLIKNMANQPVSGVSDIQFLKDWVETFLFSAQNLPSSGDAAINRATSKSRLIKAWIKNSGLPVPAVVPANWTALPLKVEEFPVRLLAIVNRLDLRGNSGYGFSNAGEGRFVFCFVDSNAGCSTGNNGPGTMTFIFEYGIPLTNCQAVKDYAKKWWDLRGMAFGGAFNVALQGITNVFTAANAKPSKPNGSALNHLRTNDFIQGPWTIRDFEITAASHKLKVIHPNKESMASSNNGNASLVAFVNSLPFAVNSSPTYTIPANLMAIHAPMPSPAHHWRGNAANVMVPVNRRGFSLETCSGCHTRETSNIFTHVKPRNVGVAAALSGFMTGLGADANAADNDADPLGSFFVSDPGPTPLANNAFNEALRRAKSLEELVFNTPCLSLTPNIADQLRAIDKTLRFRPINMEH